MHAIDLSNLPDGPVTLQPKATARSESRAAKVAESEAAIGRAQHDAKLEKRRIEEWHSARVDELNRIHRGRPRILRVALPPGSHGPCILSAYSDPHSWHNRDFFTRRSPDMVR